jgi:carboxymethylenebutenolidase
VIEKTIDITTRDGAMETFVTHPERGGPYPAVFLMMDAPGIREELRMMARRLATVGFYVLLPNLYYRAGRDTKYGPDVLTHGSAEHARMRAVRTRMTIPPVMDDVAVMLDFVAGESAAKNGPAGIHGYCMSGPLCARRRGPLPGSHRRGRIVLRHLADQRYRGKPAPQPRQDQGRGAYRLRRA